MIAVVLPFSARAQARTTDSTRTLKTVTVTATRQPTYARNVPAPVTVIDSAAIREKTPNSAADLLKEAPGVDVAGTGPSQGRPVIRGQRGQRILLLQDGLRISNSRRQQDFGELPALVDVRQLERIEVVRGPSSVLYGSDAIGGVINLITKTPPTSGPARVSGSFGYGYSGAGDQQRGEGNIAVSRNGFALSGSANVRNADSYTAPSGSFGNLRLSDDVDVNDSGVRDRNFSVNGAWRGPGRGAWLRVDSYEAKDAGFGLVEPRILGDTSARVQLTYPWQQVTKATAGFNTSALSLPFVNRVDVSAYTQRNERDFNSATDVYVAMGPGRTATVFSRSFNNTDVRTSGVRVEAAKIANRVIFTYGLDAFRDDARSADSSRTLSTGFGPTPTDRSSTTPSLANAVLRNIGVFAQGDWRLHDRFSFITGVRYNDVRTETNPTAGLPDSLTNLSATNSTGVYAVNAIYRATDNVSLVSTYGRGFRAPNLIERYFAGVASTGASIQVINPNLDAETSDNVDLGFRLNVSRVDAEYFWFRNNIRDGIVARPTGRTINRMPEYRNINTSRLVTSGHEASLLVDLGRGFALNTNYTKLTTRDPDAPDLPVSGTYSSRLNAELGYRPASARFWAAYAVRYQGQQQDINLGTSPIGSVLPSFTVMNVRAGARVATIGGRPQDIGLSINNLGNRLYAETANSAFFRPEPGRHVILSVRTTF